MKLETLTKFLDGSFGIAYNLSDFFLACAADMILIDTDDLVWVLPMFEKYGWDGSNACVAFIAKKMPIDPVITDKFKLAYAELEQLNPEINSTY